MAEIALDIWGTPVEERFVPLSYEGTEDECVDRHFREYASLLKKFPSTTELSAKTLEAALGYIKNFKDRTPDDQLMTLVDAEYRLFLMVERQRYQPRLNRLARKSGVDVDINKFLKIAQSMTQRRKSRAGRSLENHWEWLLKESNIPCAIRPLMVDGVPDVIIPGGPQYRDPSYPAAKLMMIGLKRTCKERWRQVLREARKIRTKHILTLQDDIPLKQLEEMGEAGVILIIPERILKNYPVVNGIQILTVSQFIMSAKKLLA